MELISDAISMLMVRLLLRIIDYDVHVYVRSNNTSKEWRDDCHDLTDTKGGLDSINEHHDLANVAVARHVAMRVIDLRPREDTVDLQHQAAILEQWHHGGRHLVRELRLVEIGRAHV